MPVEGWFHVVLVGFPNVGKSTLFAEISGVLNQVMNVPHSTQEVRVWEDKRHLIRWIDTPGVEAQIPDDLTSIIESADLVVWVVDVTQWNRQKQLLPQLLRFEKPLFTVLTLMDVLPKQVELSTGYAPYLQTRGQWLQFVKSWDQVKSWVKDFSKVRLEKVIQDWEPVWQQQVLPQLDQVFQNRLLRWDRWFLMSRFSDVLSLLVLIGLVGLVFSVAQPLGRSMSEWLSDVWKQVGQWVIPSGFLMLVWEAVGVALWEGLLPFAPLIFLMSFAIAWFEDAGLWARMIVLWDKWFRKLGLDGNSLLALLGSHGCVLNGIVLSRRLQPSIRQGVLRLLPLMMCSAKLPLLAATVSFLWPNLDGLMQALILLVLLILNWMLVLGLAELSVQLGIQPVNMVTWVKYSLPLWQWPRPRIILKKASWQTFHFLEKVAPIVVVVSLLASFLGQKPEMLQGLSRWLKPLTWPFGSDPTFGLGILVSFSARELFWPTVLALKSLQLTGFEFIELTLGAKLGILIFFLLAFQCISTLLMLWKEGWPFKRVVILWLGYLTTAWVLAGLARFLVDWLVRYV